MNKKKHLEKMKKLGINNKSKGEEIPKQKKTSEFFIKSQKCGESPNFKR